MKLDLKVNEYATNATTHGKFRVANNSTMQQILSKMLYSDPIKAILRELSINAMEAHLDAGQSKPFEVCLPTTANPQFSIRDYGTGLDKDKLEHLYTTYGESTKRQSDEYTGGFGIGSKSPFSYADMFYVTSYYNGTKYTVVNSQNARGEFVFDILSEVETTEPNGLEITFDVKGGDVYGFTERAREVYKWFKILPKFNTAIDIQRPLAIEKGQDWELIKYSDYYGNTGSTYIVVGQVGYKIDESQFKGNAATVLSKCSLILHANIDEVSIAPNRESLQYNKPTLDKLNGILNSFYDYTKAKVDGQIANCKSAWEAKLLAQEFFSKNAYISALLNRSFQFDGVTYSTGNSIQGSTKLELHRYSWHSYDKCTYENKKRVSVEVDRKAKFAIYQQGAYAAAKRYVDVNNDVVLYLCPIDKKQELIDTVGVLESDLLDVSKFPPAVRQARAKSTTNVIQAYRFYPRGNRNYSCRAYWNNAGIDIDNETGYYCPLKEFYIDGTSLSMGYLEDFLSGINIIGVLANREHKLLNHANWKHIREFFKEQCDILAKTKEVTTYSDIVKAGNTMLRLKGIKAHLNKGTKLYQHLEKMNEVEKAQKVVHKFNEFRDYYKRMGGPEYKVSSPKIDLNYDLKDYPLLQFINGYQFGEPAVIEYINSVKV